MNEQLPDGWGEVKLKEISKIEMGQSPESSSYNDQGEGLPFFQGKAEFGELYPTVRKWCSEPGKIAQQNDVLLSVRAPVGALNMADQICCIGRGLTAIRLLKGDNKFLYYALKTKEIQQFMAENATGSTFVAISKSVVEEITIPLPPLAEQARIVVVLDDLMTRVRSAQAQLATVPKLLKRFRQSVLSAAVSGKLTEDWREENPDVESADKLLENIAQKRKIDHKINLDLAKEDGRRKPRANFLLDVPTLDRQLELEIPNSWTFSNIDFLAYVTKLAGFEYTEYFKLKESGDIPVVRAQNVQMGHFIESNIMYLDRETSDHLERSKLFGREILMVFIGAGTGNVCLAPSDKRWHLAPNVAKIDVDYIYNEYLNFYLQSPIGNNDTLSFIKATAQPSLSMETIRQIIVPVAPLVEQKEIVYRVNSLLNWADKLEDGYKAAKRQLDAIPSAILAKAFAGELTAQKPADESAGKLLERIRAERLSEQSRPKEKRLKIDPILKKTKKMAEQLRGIKEILTATAEPVSTHAVWQQSIYKDDIEKFYADLKQLVDIEKSVEDVKDGEQSFLKLTHAD